MKSIIRIGQAGAVLSVALMLGGCATNGVRSDPLEPLNRTVYKFNDTVDKAVLKPVAKGYKAAVPVPVRTGVGNFFSNLNDVVVTANDLLQFKLGQAASDFSRIIVNTTFGVLGIFDVASKWGLEKHNEDFGQTLGRWGIGPGPYLVLPLLGPSDFRDTIGIVADSHVDPVWNTSDVATRNSLVGLDAVDTRARLLDTESILEEAAIDRYAFIRDAYLQRRQSLVYDGRPPREDLEDDSGDNAPGNQSVPPAKK